MTQPKLTPWGHLWSEPVEAVGGIQRSTIICERSPRLWRALLADIRARGLQSEASLYFDVDTSVHADPNVRGHRLLMALKEAFYGHAPVSLNALGKHIQSLPPKTPAPPLEAKEGIGMDQWGTDIGHHHLDEREQAALERWLAARGMT